LEWIQIGIWNGSNNDEQQTPLNLPPVSIEYHL